MSRQHRIVVAGCGGMSNVWIKELLKRDDALVVGLVDVHIGQAEKVRDAYGLACGVYTGLTEAIADTGADLVIDVTIPDSHFEISTTAMKQGCHVFGEKPMAATMEQARKIIETADATGRSMSVMQNRRYDANIRALRELITSGTIGRPGMINADFFLGPHFGGFRDVMESPLILDMAIHTFDQARFIAGADPVSVYCHEFNPPGSWYAGNASAVCIYEMSDGSVFSYRGSWCAEGAPTSWEGDWRIIGEKGTAIWDGVQAPYAEVVSAGEQAEQKFMRDTVRVEAPLRWNGKPGHEGCLDEMFLALKEGRPAETDCRDNIHSMAMVLGAIESAKSGRKVRLG
ncbi:Gfo/Idh/MocA family oxidoreductase [Paenibacillus woosongensis]|uniref:Gfo/Idh/MocA family oxidoreductase n=1 Tax=Paenibacillus woosongensis TaxID=307580 RepID=A0AA95IBQ6_9BACL|nr:Gfo/Idh/MocA family oxidoreductase [Paenibacillus woosongensis]WHX50252.1 Gfo/Idh/MocA family oxidoreductase [Paenibacillus woosongensis]